MDIERRLGTIYFNLSPEEYRILQEGAPRIAQDFVPVQNTDVVLYYRVGYTRSKFKDEMLKFARDHDFPINDISPTEANNL